MPRTQRLPDFLIIGAMKCGTSTLAAQLAAQPGLFMTTPKEPNFFSDDAVFARGEAWYRSLFEAASPGDLKGEASTHYTKLPTHPQSLPRMAALLGPVRLIYMIRNPVQRAVSHYLHEWSQGMMGGDPVAAFRDHGALVDYGCYGMQIRPFLDHYGPDSVLLTSLETLTADPVSELRRIGVFLGRELTYQDSLGAQNVSAARIRKLPLHGLLVDNPLATLLRRTLVPKALRRRIREARSVGQKRPDLPEDLLRRLEVRFVEDRADLVRLFPDHPALTACYPFAP